MRRSIAALVALAALTSACTSAATSPDTVPIPHQLDGAGVQLLDRDQRIDFGRTDHSAVPAMTKLIGQPPARSFDCGALAATVWPDGTALFFANGDFRGWSKAGRQAGRTCS